MNKSLSFRGQFNEEDIHECNVTKKKDWIVFKCPICKDYERHINLKTKEMFVVNDKPSIKHHGVYDDSDFDSGQLDIITLN